jgi:hypothetical protein
LFSSSSWSSTPHQSPKTNMLKLEHICHRTHISTSRMSSSNSF